MSAKGTVDANKVVADRELGLPKALGIVDLNFKLSKLMFLVT